METMQLSAQCFWVHLGVRANGKGFADRNFATLILNMREREHRASQCRWFEYFVKCESWSPFRRDGIRTLGRAAPDETEQTIRIVYLLTVNLHVLMRAYKEIACASTVSPYTNLSILLLIGSVCVCVCICGAKLKKQMEEKKKRAPNRMWKR